MSGMVDEYYLVMRPSTLLAESTSCESSSFCYEVATVILVPVLRPSGQLQEVGNGPKVHHEISATTTKQQRQGGANGYRTTTMAMGA